MSHTTINCFGGIIEIPAFMRQLWPFEIPLEKWPSFCGTGDGMGDRIVPDTICGAWVQPACFVHDLDWAAGANSIWSEISSNWRLYRNLRSLCAAQLSGIKLWRAYARCLLYWAAVSTVGHVLFKAGELDRVVTDDPLDQPVVRDKIKRLARVSIGMADTLESST